MIVLAEMTIVLDSIFATGVERGYIRLFLNVLENKITHQQHSVSKFFWVIFPPLK